MITLARVYEALKAFPNSIEAVGISDLGACAHIRTPTHEGVRIEYNASEERIVTFVIGTCHITVTNFFGSPDIDVELTENKYLTVSMTQKDPCNSLFLLWKNEVREEIQKFFNA